MQWWNAREPRERVLLAAALALVLLIGLFQFVFMPSQSYRARAENRFQTSAGTYQEVKQTLDRRTDSKSVQRVSSQLPLQSVISDTSAVFGLAISRIEPTQTGDLTLWLDEAPPQMLYAWLSDLESGHGVSVGKASIRMNRDDATVSANIFVSRGF